MTESDSPIIDFYPDDFDIDMNGKKMVWQGVALLPFIDEKRLLKALKSKETELSEDEKRRNRWGDNVMFIGDHNALYDPFCGLYTLKPATKVSRFRLLLEINLLPGLRYSPSLSILVYHKGHRAPCSQTLIACHTLVSKRRSRRSKNAPISPPTTRYLSDTTSLVRLIHISRSYCEATVRTLRSSVNPTKTGSVEAAAVVQVEVGEEAEEEVAEVDTVVGQVWATTHLAVLIGQTVMVLAHTAEEDQEEDHRMSPPLDQRMKEEQEGMGHLLKRHTAVAEATVVHLRPIRTDALHLHRTHTEERAEATERPQRLMEDTHRRRQEVETHMPTRLHHRILMAHRHHAMGMEVQEVMGDMGEVVRIMADRTVEDRAGSLTLFVSVSLSEPDVVMHSILHRGIPLIY